MKRILTTALACAAIVFASCTSNDIGQNGPADGYQTVSVVANLQDAPASYGRSSNQGGLANAVEGYNLRYVVGIYDKDGDELISALHQIVPTTNSSATFDLRLLANKYKLVFWADFTEEDVTAQTEGTGTDTYYNTADLAAVSFTDSREGVGNHEALDAYTAITDIDVSSGSIATGVPIKLKRPFGKMRVLATDIPNVSDYVPTSVTITYDTEIGTAFNAITGVSVAGSTASDASYTYELGEGKEWEDVANVGKVLAFDYLLPGTINFTIATSNGTTNTSREIVSVPVATNKLTTVKGSVLTYKAKLTVVVGDIFSGNVDHEVVETVEGLNNALSNGITNIVMSAPLSEEATIEIPTSIPADKPVTLEIPAGGNNINISDASPQGQAPALTLTVTDAAEIVVNTPNSTVNFNGDASKITATTAENTFIVGEGASVETLSIQKGSVIINGTVTTIEKGNNAGLITWNNVTDIEKFEKVLPIADIISLGICDIDYSSKGTITPDKDLTIQGISKEVSKLKASFSSAKALTLQNIDLVSTVNPVINIAAEGSLTANGCKITQNKAGTADGIATSPAAIYTKSDMTLKGCEIFLNGKAYVRGINADIESPKSATIILDSTSMRTAGDDAANQMNATYSRGINAFANNNQFGSLEVKVINKSRIAGFYYPVNLPTSGSGVKVTISNSELDGYGALNIHSSNNTFTITGSKLIGRNIYGGSSSNFSVITCTETSGNNTLNITDSEIVAMKLNTCNQTIASLRSTGNTLAFKGNTILRETGKVVDYLVSEIGSTYDTRGKNTITADETVVIDAKEGVELFERPDLYGEGTEAKPFLVSTAKEFMFIANTVQNGEDNAKVFEGKYFEMTNDIDFAGYANFLSMGSDTNVGNTVASKAGFAGIFDGKGFTVKNITIRNAQRSAGVFGTTRGATIKNLKVDGLTIDMASKWAGGLIGDMQGGIVDNCHVKNVLLCKNPDPATYPASGGGVFTGYDLAFRLGGLIGICRATCEVKNSSVDGATINGSYSFGGLIGACNVNDNKMTISGCSVNNINLNHKVNSTAGEYLDSAPLLGDCMPAKVIAMTNITIGSWNISFENDADKQLWLKQTWTIFPYVAEIPDGAGIKPTLDGTPLTPGALTEAMLSGQNWPK